MNLRKIAFLTLENSEGFFIYDEMAKSYLEELGWILESVPWSYRDIDWSKYAAVVIRSTWDYQKRFEEFLGVLKTISAAGIPLANSVDLVKWNLHKHYLKDLQSRNVSIVPTLWLPKEFDSSYFDQAFSEFNSDEIVLKPCIGANADGIVRIRRDDSSASRLGVLANTLKCEYMLQPFLESICSVGETSLIYFGEEFSHAVRKQPARGDFRVQEEHGGKITAVEVKNDEKILADKTIQSLPEKSLYSRVDIVRLKDGSPALIEVELCEPSLYFPYGQGSAARFAQAIDLYFRL